MSRAWLKALKELTKRPPADDDIEQIYQELVSGRSDRGTALVAATYLEESLRRLIKSRMVKLSKTEENALFDRDAPLSTFSKLIRVAHAFGLIDSSFRRDLDCVREVRNAFAHGASAITFSTPEVRDACRQLTKHFDRFAALGEIGAEHPKSYYLGATVHMADRLNSARDNRAADFPLGL